MEPGETHDRFRVIPEGEGTFREILKTAELFRKFGVEYNILTVCQCSDCEKNSEHYSYYKKNGFRYLQFIPCLDPLGEEPGQREYSLTPKAYGEFLCLAV